MGRYSIDIALDEDGRPYIADAMGDFPEAIEISGREVDEGSAGIREVSVLVAGELGASNRVNADRTPQPEPAPEPAPGVSEPSIITDDVIVELTQG